MSPAGFARLTPHIINWIKNIAGLNKVHGFKCIDGWTYNLETRKCYKYFEKTTSWKNATNDCRLIFTRGVSSPSQKIRGTLAIIETEEDVKFISKHDRNIKSAQFWVGGRKEDGKWLWLDGTELNVGKWAPNQPDNYLSGEDKLAMVKDTWIKEKGKWNDNHFDNLGFVCQYLASETGM